MWGGGGGGGGRRAALRREEKRKQEICQWLPGKLFYLFTMLLNLREN